MGILRVDHPDIEEFIRVKQNTTNLTQFNLSIAITDEFMHAKAAGEMFDLRFNGRVYKQVDARLLWEEIMRSTWDWAEPGVLFIDTINRFNNLYYCEDIAATNPCGEQPLPPYGACLLGSFNLVKYIVPVFDDEDTIVSYEFDYAQLKLDIPHVVRAMDNIHDTTVFPLPEQEAESKDKRRMGLGITGLANAGEILGHAYGSENFLQWTEGVLEVLRDDVYEASIELAREKGAFPMFDAEQYVRSAFIQTLPAHIIDRIGEYGIRNSHLLSFAPTGTISLCADNVSGGIEPVFAHSFERTIQTPNGERIEHVKDYAYRFYGVEGRKATELGAEEHLAVLALCTRFVDSACSKTVNVDPKMAWEEFTGVYDRAWELKCKGITTFNPSGKRFGILNEREEEAGEACYISAETGQKECS
jgi:ribonucleoside-diphosphate reductase alpha chain